ncbi:hypothetical protein QBE52_01475 [Clostridiaceae bacterium 35-E11]
MNTMIRLGDLGFMLLGVALLILIIYAILFLKNLNATVKEVKDIVVQNRDSIDKVLDQAPSIATHIESMSADLSRDVKAVQGTIDQIVGTTEAAAGALAENTDIWTTVLGIIQVGYVLKEFVNGFTRKKRWL